MYLQSWLGDLSQLSQEKNLDNEGESMYVACPHSKQIELKRDNGMFETLPVPRSSVFFLGGNVIG